MPLAIDFYPIASAAASGIVSDHFPTVRAEPCRDRLAGISACAKIRDGALKAAPTGPQRRGFGRTHLAARATAGIYRDKSGAVRTETKFQDLTIQDFPPRYGCQGTNLTVLTLLL